MLFKDMVAYYTGVTYLGPEYYRTRNICFNVFLILIESAIVVALISILWYRSHKPVSGEVALSWM